MIINFFFSTNTFANRWSKLSFINIHFPTLLISKMCERRARRNVVPLSTCDKSWAACRAGQCRPSALFSNGDVLRTLKSIESIEESATARRFFTLPRRRPLLSLLKFKGTLSSIRRSGESRKHYPSRLITPYSEMTLVSKDDDSIRAVRNERKRHEQFFFFSLPLLTKASIEF